MAKKARRGLVPGCTRKRRHKDDTRKQLERLREEHYPGSEIERDIQERKLTPRRELIMRRILHGAASTQLLVSAAC